MKVRKKVLTCIVGALVLALAGISPLFAADEQWFEGSAMVRVKGGNTEKAKEKAFEKAEWDALKKALSTIIGDVVEDDDKMAEVQEKFMDDFDKYVKDEVTLSETPKGRRFKTAIKVQFNMRAVRREIKKIMGASKDGIAGDKGPRFLFFCNDEWAENKMSDHFAAAKIRFGRASEISDFSPLVTDYRKGTAPDTMVFDENVKAVMLQKGYHYALFGKLKFRPGKKDPVTGFDTVKAQIRYSAVELKSGDTIAQKSERFKGKGEDDEDAKASAVEKAAKSMIKYLFTQIIDEWSD